MPRFLFSHLSDRLLRDIKEAGEISADDVLEVFFGIVRERLGNKNPRVVDEHIDLAKLLDGGVDDANSRLFRPDITVHKSQRARFFENFRLTDGARIRNDIVSAFQQRLAHSQADSAGCASNNRR